MLEIAGFGNSQKLAAQFYFKEWTVLKVMFGAIIVAVPEGKYKLCLKAARLNTNSVNEEVSGLSLKLGITDIQVFKWVSRSSTRYCTEVA